MLHALISVPFLVLLVSGISCGLLLWNFLDVSFNSFLFALRFGVGLAVEYSSRLSLDL